MLWYNTFLNSSPQCILKGAVTCYLEIVCKGLVRNLTSGKVRCSTRTKIFASVFCGPYPFCKLGWGRYITVG